MFNWLNFLLYAIITSFTPGPNNIMSMTNGKIIGIKKSLPFCVGVFLGVFILLVLSAWLTNTISTIIPKVSLPLRILGCVYMLYLAYKTFTANTEIKENLRKTNIFIGMVLQFINPKTYLYCIVSMELYVLPYFSEEPFTVILLALLLSVFALLSNILWSSFGKVFTLIFSKYAKITNSIMALLLAYCSVSLFL